MACVLGVLSVSTRSAAESVDPPGVAPEPSLEPPSAPMSVPVPVPVASVAEAEDATWQTAYLDARWAMTQGRFAVARDSFAALAGSTRSAEKRALCTEFGALAAQWATAGLTLLPQQARAAAEPLSTARSDERTTDEISVLYLNSVVYGLGTVRPWRPSFGGRLPSARSRAPRLAAWRGPHRGALRTWGRRRSGAAS